MTDSTSIAIKNFKSYQDATLPLAPLTLLIGANASGKSNAIEAFRFLSWVAGGERLSTLKNWVNDSDKVVRGSARDLAYFDTDEFAIFFQYKKLMYESTFKIENNKLFFKHEIIQINEERVCFYADNRIDYPYKKSDTQEKLSNNAITVFDSYNTSDSSAIKKAQFYIEKDTLLSSNFLDSLENMDNNLTNTYFFDFIPSSMQTASLAENDLRQNGMNLAGVMYQLCQDNVVKDKLLAMIRSLPEQNIHDIKFYVDHRQRVEFSLVESFAGSDKECPMDLLSDGTLKVLGIATALLSVPKGSTIVIEEIDNSIHPTRAYDILSLMHQYANERKLKLLLSTHNPALMDALPDEALADVVFCYRDPQQGDSRLIRLGDLEDYLGLVSQGSLGELVTKGVVERFVKHPTTPQQRKQQALDWLNQLQEAE
ncbi:AAA family ATPase [Psychrobacter sp. I-STPA10]|uniref:AAA family ATPase n=1 Tax=Psychrobacter sp. I-STPA10 TaxID=2585769 RepID=UPI001E3F4BAC|nr:ATP-binding protein [Psychrobacter sp. I-STPA10]